MNKWIGITGKMASGKSTLVQLLKERNADYVYVDVDEFRRSLFQNEEYVRQLKQEILELNAYDSIDSSILNQFIYQNEDYMNYYKKILYQYLFSYLESLGDQVVIVEWALLLQDHLDSKFSKIVYVDTPDSVRMERLMDSDLSMEEIEKRFMLQDQVILDSYVLKDNFLLVDGKNLDVNQVSDFIDEKPMECKFTLDEDGGKAIWEITHQCNYHCSYCIFSCNSKKISGELSTEECFHVIDELVKNGFKYLKITGGEPFLRKDILDILRYASKRMITDISTNASLITEEMVEELNQIPLKMIHVSLDGNLKEHEAVRGENTYLRTIRGLECLKKSKNKVRIGSVIHKENENSLENVVKIGEEFLADEVIFSIMELIHGQDISQCCTKNNEALVSILDEIKKEHPNICVSYNFGKQPNYVCRCPGGDKFIYINHLGQISPCTWIAEKDSSFISKGSLKEQELSEIMEEEKLQKFVKSKKRGFCYGKI